jgi:hypothetical protein
MNRNTHWTELYTENRYAVLFYSLLATLGVGPVVRTTMRGDWLFEALLGFNLLAACFSARGPLRRGLFLAALLLPALARLIPFAERQRLVNGVWSLVWTALGLWAAASALKFAFRAVQVRREHIYAALSAYLLAGLFFGLLYFALSSAITGLFHVGGAAAALTSDESVYFSFVTLATLGYGDIVPAAEISRGLAILEAVAGQLYIAVLVARLVAAYREPA